VPIAMHAASASTNVTILGEGQRRDEDGNADRHALIDRCVQS
jgi:hypothetical protein